MGFFGGSLSNIGLCSFVAFLQYKGIKVLGRPKGRETLEAKPYTLNPKRNAKPQTLNPENLQNHGPRLNPPNSSFNKSMLRVNFLNLTRHLTVELGGSGFRV